MQIFSVQRIRSIVLIWCTALVVFGNIALLWYIPYAAFDERSIRIALV